MNRTTAYFVEYIVVALIVCSIAYAIVTPIITATAKSIQESAARIEALGR